LIKKISTRILFAHFQYTKLDGASYESTDINVFHFALQNDNALINAACLRDANACNETEFKIGESQRNKANSTIEGMHVNDIEDVVKVCAIFVPSSAQSLMCKGGDFLSSTSLV
jgi:hypothetical protein